MLKSEDSKRVIFQYDSIVEMMRQFETTPAVWTYVGSRTISRSSSWDDNVGYDGACRMAVEGWPDGVGRVAALVDSLPTGARVVRSYSMAGDYPDVPRAVSGDPFNMVKRGLAHKTKPTMTIAVNCCTSGSVHASAMMNFAAAMVAVIDRLENQGVSVELLAMAVTSLADGRKGSVVWTVKNAGEPADLSAIAFGIGHPAMFRRLCFAAWERMPRSMQTSSYGGIITATRDHFVDLAPEALIIGGVGRSMDGNVQANTMQGTVEFAKRQINAAAKALGHEPIAELELL